MTQARVPARQPPAAPKPHRRPASRRWLRRALVALLTLAVVGVAGLAAFERTLPTDQVDIVAAGSLRVDSAARGSWRVGDLTVAMGGTGLIVSSPERVVWASDPGVAFITGGRGAVTWQDHLGYFWPRVEHRERLGNQSVEGVRVERDGVEIEGHLSGDGGTAAYTMVVRADAHGAAIDVSTTADLSTVGLVSGRSAHAGVHGFGEQFTAFDLDGRLLPIVDREQGVGRGEQPITLLADLTNRGAGGHDEMTYAAWASWVTDDLRGVQLDPDRPESHAFAVADLRVPTRVGLEVWAPRLRAIVSAAASPIELVATQQAGTTRPELPSWVSEGAVVGLQGGSSEVRRKLEVLLGAGAKISGVWLQDWTGRRTTSFGDRLWWTWQLDKTRYPDWPALVHDLSVRGIAVTTYVNPWLVDAAPKGDPTIRNLWSEARSAGYLVRDQAGGPYMVDQGGFSASLVDLTSSRARSWFADVIAREVLANGVAGFMADFGEGLPFDAKLSSGNPLLLHNEWPRLWAETIREGCQRAGRSDCVTWMRAGALGQGADVPMFWEGDQLVDFGAEDGMASTLLGKFSAGVSGWPLVHSDVGGYTSVNAVVRNYTRSAELLERWAELEAFGVMMRTHEGNRPAANAQVYDSPTSAAAFARMTRVYAALAPYRQALLRESARTGVPAVRHGWLAAPHTAAAKVDTQFFLGSSVLVAPVLESGADAVEVTLPPGRWKQLFTGEELDGGRTIEVSAPVGTPAAFGRVGDPWTERLHAALAAAVE